MVGREIRHQRLQVDAPLRVHERLHPLELDVGERVRSDPQAPAGARLDPPATRRIDQRARRDGEQPSPSGSTGRIEAVARQRPCKGLHGQVGGQLGASGAGEQKGQHGIGVTAVEDPERLIPLDRPNALLGLLEPFLA